MGQEDLRHGIGGCTAWNMRIYGMVQHDLGSVTARMRSLSPAISTSRKAPCCQSSVTRTTTCAVFLCATGGSHTQSPGCAGCKWSPGCAGCKWHTVPRVCRVQMAHSPQGVQGANGTRPAPEATSTRSLIRSQFGLV